jgi:hypothetical protein
MKVGDLTTFGTILEVKGNPADVTSRWYPEPRKIALVMPFDGSHLRWEFVTVLRNQMKRTRQEPKRDTASRMENK